VNLNVKHEGLRMVKTSPENQDPF